MGIGVPELLIVLAILLLVFGPKRLPQLGRQLGGGMREFRDSIRRKTGDDDEDDADRPAAAAALPEASPTATQPERDPVSPPRP